MVLKKVILRCIGLCFNYHHLYLLSRLDQPLIQRIPAGLSSTVACLDITRMVVLYGWPFVAKFKNILFSFKDLYLYSTTNIHSTSTPYIFIQHKYSFNFNSNYFHSTQIFIQLQHHIFSFNTNIHSTSTPYIFIQHKYSFNFNTIYFHSTQIFIQLQRKNIHSTFCKFPDIPNFHSTKLPVPTPTASNFAHTT